MHYKGNPTDSARYHLLLLKLKLKNHGTLMRSSFTLVILVTLILTIAAIATSRSGWLASLDRPTNNKVFQDQASAQQPPSKKSVLNTRLSVEPEANRLRCRLGKRFLSEGNTTTEIVAGLTIGTQRQPVRMIRSFDEKGEIVAIAQGGGSPTLIWSDANGATTDGAQATGETRVMIERLALDTPDQFVLAKLRGTAYQIVARNVRPSEAGKGSNYKGPLWDLVRIGEPQKTSKKTPLSTWRQYYINSTTGLIDRVLSQENGQTITAEVSDWKQQGSETFPNKITWLRGKQVLMELAVNSIIFKSKQ